MEEEENIVLNPVSPKGKIDFGKAYKQAINGKRLGDSSASNKTYYAPGIGESQYDKDIKLDAQIDFGAAYQQSLESNRALLQPKIAELGNALGRLSNIIPEAIGGLAAVVDFEDYFNSNDEVGNWLTDLTNQWKESTNEALPIYRENPGEALDFGDSAWWMSNGSSLVQSIGGFAITGGVVTKGLQGLSKAAKLAKLTSKITGANIANKIGEGVQTLSTAMALNQAEAILEAGEVYTEIYNSKLNHFLTNGDSQEIAESKARQKAADAASVTVNANRINILLNISSANLFVKTPRLTRNILSKESTLSNLGRASIEGAQESAEELVNFTASNLGKAKGYDKDYTMKDLYNDLTTKEAAEAALLGFLGGMGQTIITKEGVNRINKVTDPDTGKIMSVKDYNKFVYNKQQEEINQINSLKSSTNVKSFTDVYNSLEDQKLINQELEQAIKNNDDNKAELLQKASLDRQALNSFKSGTTETLLELYRDLGNSDQKEGMSDNYKQRSQEAINRIEKLEKIYNEVGNEVNASQLYSNRALTYNYEDQIDKVNENLNTKELELERKKDRLRNVTKNENLRKEHDKYLTKGDPLNKNIEDLKNELESLSSFIGFLNDNYKTINSSKYKKYYAEKLKKSKEEAEENLDEVSDQVEEEYKQEVQDIENKEVEKAIKEDIKTKEKINKENNDIKKESNTTYKSLQELIDNADDYGLEFEPNGTSVVTTPGSELHIPVLENLKGFENIDVNTLIMLTPTLKGIEVTIGNSKTKEVNTFLVEEYNVVEDNNTNINVDNKEDVNNNDKSLPINDNLNDSKSFEEEQETKLNKAKDASLVNAPNSDYTSDNYTEYAENPRNKVGEEVTFDIGVNESTSNQSEIDKIEAERKAELTFDKIKKSNVGASSPALWGNISEIQNKISNDFKGNSTLTVKDYINNSKRQVSKYSNEKIEEWNLALKNVINAKYDAKIASLKNNDGKVNSIKAQDAIELYKSAIRGDIKLNDKQLKQLTLNLPIKVNFNETTFTHLPFESEESSVSLTDAEYNLREQIISQALLNKSLEGISSKIAFQYPGIIKQDVVNGKPAQNNILELPSINGDLSKVEYFISDSNGNILDLDNEPSDSFGKSKHAGNIFIKVPTANGKNFPLKLNIRRVNKLEADVVLRITQALLDPSNKIKFNANIDTVLDIIKFTPQELESVKQEVKLLGKNLKNTKVMELMNSIVFEGNSKKNAFKISGSKLTYGETIIDFKDFESNKAIISNWLTTNKNRNVKKAKLKEKTYKDFFSNNVLSTDAKLGEATFGGNTKIYLETKINNNTNPESEFASSGATFNKFLDASKDNPKNETVPVKVDKKEDNIKNVTSIKTRKNIKNKLKKGSSLGKELIKIYKDIDKASDVYSKLSHPLFLKKFGDWLTFNIDLRTNDLGEPLLIERIGVNGAKNYYFLDQYNNKIDLITNEFSSFPASNLTNVINEITQQIGNYIFNKHIKENFNDLENLKGINLNNEILNFVEDKIKENEDLKNYTDDIESLDYIIEQLNNIKTHVDEFEVELFNYFKSKNLNIKEEESEDNTQQSLEEGLQGGDIKQSFENNTKDKATANTKLLLSFLPKYEYNIEEGEYEIKYGGILGEETFMRMDSIHQELLKEFTDLVPKETISGIEDVYDIMINKIVDLAKSKPYYGDLLTILEDLDDNKKTEFVIAFSHKFNNFIVSSWNKDDKTYKIINSSTQNNVDSQILNNWSKAFRNKFIVKETTVSYLPNLSDKKNPIKTESSKKTFSKKLIDKLDSDIKKLSDTFYNSNKGYDINNISNEEFAKKFYESSLMLENVLKSIGVELDSNAFRYYMSKLNNDSLNSGRSEYIKTMITTINGLKGAVKSLKSKKDKIKSYNLITDYKSALFGDLAKAEAFFNEDLTDTNVLANNKMYWAFSNPSYISNTVNKYKQQPETLRDLIKDPINNNSKLAQHLLGEDKNDQGDYVFDKSRREIESAKRLKVFRLDLFTSFQEENKANEGVSNKDISETDQLIDEINKVERAGLTNSNGSRIGYRAVYSTSTPADKPTRHELNTDMFMTDIVESSNNNGEISAVFSDKILNTFKDYFLDEYNRMKKASKEIENLKEKDLIVHYHTKNGQIYDEKGVLLGNAFKSQLFPELSFDTIDPVLNESLGLYDSKGLPRNKEEIIFSETQEEIIKKVITGVFNNMINDNIQELIKKRILVLNIAPNGSTRYLTSGIDKRVLQEYGADKEGYLTQSGVTNLVSSYTLNSTIANVEYTKLFTGDPAMYKNMVDFFKRVPSTYTDGLPLRLSEESDKHFKISVIENQIVQAPYLKEIKESLKKVGKTDSEIKAITNLYEDDVNSTDAQAWITPDRWKFIIEKTGKWNDRRQRIYDHMLGKNTEKLSADDFKYAAQPLKGVYFGVVNGVPTYLKYSQAVLIPSMIKGTQLDNLYASMVKSKIDEAITLDGIKVGAKTPNKITDDLGNIINSNLTSITLNNAEWKLQQDLPTKLMKPTLIGSQIQKNIFSSIEPDKPYYLSNGDIITGLEMIERINDALSKMSNKGIEKLSLDLGLDENGVIDKDKFYKILENEVLDGNYSINTIKAVQKGLPLEALPGLKNKLNNIFFSKVRSAAVKIKSNGGSFIQMSNFGLDKTVADEVGVKWLVEPDVLKPPVIVEIDGIKKIQPGQIFINHSIIAKYIPGYEKMSIEEINSKIDPRLLQAIGYRIPNQGMSSNDPLQIVGILPPTIGDTIVGYTEIPTKTGSDFDIDKMYVMLPEYGAKYSKSTYKKVKEFLSGGLDGLSIEQENKILGDIIDQTNIELTVEQTKNLLFANNEYDTNDVYYNSIIEHLMDTTSNSEISKQYRDSYNVDKVESIVYIDSKGDSNKALNNNLFELYWSVLTNENTYADLITPIDFDYLKNHVKYLHGDNSKQTGENLKFYNPIFQLKLKHIYAGGKSGVGITATQLVDHNRSKHVVNLKFRNYNLGENVGYNVNGETLFDTLNGNNLSTPLITKNKEYSGTQFKISDTISAFLNAFVDNAKDPYINDGNFNTYTSGAAFMMIRAGVHPYYVNAFIGQPILKNLAQFVKDYESKSTDKKEPWKSSKRVFKEEYARKILGNNPTNKEVASFLNKFKDGKVFSYDELENNILNNNTLESDNQYMIDQLEILYKFEEYVDQAKKLNESVALSRFDTEGAGKNFVDMITYTNRIKELLSSENNDKSIVNHKRKYIQDGKLTSLGTQLLNTLEYAKDIINNNDDLFLLSSQPVIDIMNEITMNTVNSIGGSLGLIKDSEIGSLVSNEIYTYLMSKFPALQIENNKLGFIQETMEDILKYKSEQEEDIDERNFFIDSLVFYDESFGINFGNMSKQVKDQLYRSFRDLYLENTELGNKIIKSSFNMNGFNSNLIDFRDFIPHEFFIKNNFRDFLRKQSINLNKGEYSNDFISKLIKNNSDNNKLVPVISAARVKVFKHKIGNFHPTIGFTIDSQDELNIRAYGLGKNNNNEIMFPRFLKMKNNSLYELHGYINNNPYYKRIPKFGYKSKKSHLNIKEYDTNLSEFNNDNNTIRAIQESEKKALGYSKSLDYISRDLFNNFVIPDIYTKNLEEILLPQENVVSLQEDIQEIDPFEGSEIKEEDQNNCK